jgi:hypothetical protein
MRYEVISEERQTTCGRLPLFAYDLNNSVSFYKDINGLR